MAVNWREWVEDRFALEPIREVGFLRKVPGTPWYYGDGAALVLLFGVLVVTGMFLALSYSPSPDTAYSSVRYLTERATLGWFVRGLHYWSAGLMMVMAWFHLFREIIVGGYRMPREGTWFLGVLLLFGIFIMSFTGYLLRWDERALYSTLLSLHMFQNIPLIGDEIVLFVQGGPELGARTLTRFYAMHLLFTPAAMGLVLAGHLYLIYRHGVTSAAERRERIQSREQQRALYAREKERGEPFYPDTMAKSGLFALAVFLMAAGLALFSGPLPMYPEANLVNSTMPQGEWWYWWYSALIALVPSRIAPWLVVIFPPLLFLALVALPFLDRNPYRDIRRRPWMGAAVTASAATLLWLSYLRYHSPWTGWPTEALPPVPQEVRLSPRAQEGRALFSRYGCNSCHPIAGRGPHVGPDLMRIGRRRTPAQTRSQILGPPPGSPMPSYADRLSEEELSRLVTFLMELQR
ncbi:MAG: cytochrome b N-terminal domain-containing protein [Armatimonadetes bacterium]|nr:cytochrome b N-terminal domain-containing protein [Armatimonadota bacterium]